MMLHVLRHAGSASDPGSKAILYSILNKTSIPLNSAEIWEQAEVGAAAAVSQCLHCLLLKLLCTHAEGWSQEQAACQDLAALHAQGWGCTDKTNWKRPKFCVFTENSHQKG